jgi:hypothetical protein
MESEMSKAVLRGCELFQRLDDEDLALLMTNGQQKQLPRGKILYLKGVSNF